MHLFSLSVTTTRDCPRRHIGLRRTRRPVRALRLFRTRMSSTSPWSFDGTPQAVRFTADGDCHLVDVPFITRRWPVAPDQGSDLRPEPLDPCPGRLVAHRRTALSQHIVNVPKAQVDPAIAQNRVSDHRLRGGDTHSTAISTPNPSFQNAMDAGRSRKPDKGFLLFHLHLSPIQTKNVAFAIFITDLLLSPARA